MKVLIIEDHPEKSAELGAYLQSEFEISELHAARSLKSGLRHIFDIKPDLILLDMTMPNFDRSLNEEGGRPHAFAGREVLRQMQRARIRTPVLIVTQFDRFGEEVDYIRLDELKSDLRSQFQNYIGAVQFRSNVDDWKPAIDEAIGTLLVRKVRK